MERQGVEPFPLASRQDHCQNIPHSRASLGGLPEMTQVPFPLPRWPSLPVPARPAGGGRQGGRGCRSALRHKAILIKS
jgi:hypothetical protein